MRAFCFGGLWHLKLEHPILQCGGGFRRNHLGRQIDHAHGGYAALWFNDVIEITGLRAEGHSGCGKQRSRASATPIMILNKPRLWAFVAA